MQQSISIITLSLILVLIVSLTSPQHAHAVLSNQKDGYHVYGSSDATFQLSVVIDLLCPFSAEAWESVRTLPDHYEPDEVAIIAPIHALPYHRNSWMTALGAEIVNQRNGSASAVGAYIEAVFKQQEAFGVSVTQTQVTRHLARIAADDELFGSRDVATSLGVIQRGLVDDDIEDQTRDNWKHIVRHGIAGTPTFLVNGKEVDEPESDWTPTQWRDYINAYLKDHKGEKGTAYIEMKQVRDAVQTATGFNVMLLLLGGLIGSTGLWTASMMKSRRDLYTDIDDWTQAA